MADINSGRKSGGDTGSPGPQHARGAYPAGARDASPLDAPGHDALIGLVELLFFAYRDFTGEADAVLQEFEFGRAHHRVLHFVNRQPGLRVADLLDILRITKQSLARVLKELVDRDFIAQAAGAKDRRERRLYLTVKGKALAAQLAGLQIAQIGRALGEAGAAMQSGAGSEAVVREFLLAMIGPEQRANLVSAAIGEAATVKSAVMVGAAVGDLAAMKANPAVTTTAARDRPAVRASKSREAK